MEQQTAALASELVHRYGSEVSVEYVDVYSEKMFTDYTDILRVLTRQQVPLPLIAVNDKPRWVGGISAEMICQEIEKLGLQPVTREA